MSSRLRLGDRWAIFVPADDLPPSAGHDLWEIP
jgi:hypothetical protein